MYNSWFTRTHRGVSTVSYRGWDSVVLVCMVSVWTWLVVNGGRDGI